MYDLHLHSTYSDGDLDAVELMREAKRRGLTGVSLTDHNGIWGVTEAAREAATLGLAFVPGIEISALYQQTDVHLLGYSSHFLETLLEQGLAGTRRGYQERVAAMVSRCHRAGFKDIALNDIYGSRLQQHNPSFISYDVAKQLRVKHQLSSDEARKVTVKGGACYVPYGAWALHPIEVIRLVHEAGGIVVLAHPGTVAHEGGQAVLEALLAELVPSGLDGIEVFHPFHSPKLIKELRGFVRERDLIFTGGSDWHGVGRYHDSDFGKIGLSSTQFARLRERL